MQLCVHGLVRREVGGGGEGGGGGGGEGGWGRRLEKRLNPTTDYFPCRIKEALPVGRSFVCMDNRELPQILQQILSSTLT